MDLNYIGLSNMDLEDLLKDSFDSFSFGKIVETEYCSVTNINIPEEWRQDWGQGTKSPPVPPLSWTVVQNSQDSGESSACSRKRPDENVSEQPGCSKSRKVDAGSAGPYPENTEDTNAATQPIKSSAFNTSSEKNAPNENPETQRDATDDHGCLDREQAENLLTGLNKARVKRHNLRQIVGSGLISIQSGLMDILERDLGCTMCNEVAIMPTLATCDHIFCFPCIPVCNIRSHKHPCPRCQTEIVFSARFSSLDPFLSHIYNLLPDETRKNRERTLTERLGPENQAVKTFSLQNSRVSQPQTQAHLNSNTPCGQLIAENLQRELNQIRAECENLQHVVDSKLISIQRGLQNLLKNYLRCTACKQVVTRSEEANCGHLFCSNCIKVRMPTRASSCPSCGKERGSSVSVRALDTFLSRVHNLLRDFSTAALGTSPAVSGEKAEDDSSDIEDIFQF